jgi:hypothetical protein
MVRAGGIRLLSVFLHDDHHHIYYGCSVRVTLVAYQLARYYYIHLVMIGLTVLLNQ